MNWNLPDLDIPKIIALWVVNIFPASMLSVHCPLSGASSATYMYLVSSYPLMATYDKNYKEPDIFGEPYPELVSFFQKYEPKGHVLDLGCGQGRDAIALSRMGYRVTGVDVSKVGISQMMSVARKEKLDVAGHVSDMYEYPIDDRYDIILLDSMLHFYPRDLEKETRFLLKIMADLNESGLLCLVVWK